MIFSVASPIFADVEKAYPMEEVCRFCGKSGQIGGTNEEKLVTPCYCFSLCHPRCLLDFITVLSADGNPAFRCPYCFQHYDFTECGVLLVQPGCYYLEGRRLCSFAGVFLDFALLLIAGILSVKCILISLELYKEEPALDIQAVHWSVALATLCMTRLLQSALYFREVLLFWDDLWSLDQPVLIEEANRPSVFD